MFCCSPCAITIDKDDKHSYEFCSTGSMLCWLHPFCTDCTSLVAFGYYLGKRKDSAEITCQDFCCVPCKYADERNPKSVPTTSDIITVQPGALKHLLY